MSCTLSKSIKKSSGCTEFSFGGVDNILIGDYNLISGMTETTGGTVDAMDGVFFEYDSQEQTANFTQELVKGTNTYFTQTVNLTLSALSDEEYTELETLARMKKLTVLVKHKTGTWYGFGLKGTGLSVTAMTDDSGTAFGDGHTTIVTLSGPNLGRYQIVDSAVAEALIP
ncbi:hypothetical protein OKW21_006046 [Catalinimonas alkaloidigena]|uniref:hypothetical protein n=1 Tax=Catalinimonas alkaloidigena TaxID=1075417 RepID=UPI00240497A5|nr:hypothetical protein [Catalinimonas alkaloidigena]MDF9800783.1 hypothetical protein [Catalinimonas alkaloidigena]